MNKYEIDLSRSFGKINLWIKNFNVSAYTEDNEELWGIISLSKWTCLKDKKREGEIKYLYSNKYKKTLHRVVMDFYFGENYISKAIDDGMIIEHANNNGLDCSISNLYLLRKSENTYKGQHFDKRSESTINKYAVRMKHLYTEKTFQIMIIFTDDFRWGKDLRDPIDTIYLFYNIFDYGQVCKDADRIISNLTDVGLIDLESHDYKFINYEITFGKTFIRSQENEDIFPAAVKYDNGDPYIILGDSNTIIRLDKKHKNKNE